MINKNKCSHLDSYDSPIVLTVVYFEVLQVFVVVGILTKDFDEDYKINISLCLPRIKVVSNNSSEMTFVFPYLLFISFIEQEHMNSMHEGTEHTADR